MREIGGDDGHWGPIRRKEVELKSAVDDLFGEIERIVEGGAGVYFSRCVGVTVMVSSDGSSPFNISIISALVRSVRACSTM